MNIRITGRRYAVSEAVEKRIQKKLGKLSKFFGEDEMVNVVLTKEKSRNIMEATISHKGIIYRAEEESGDMFSSIDRVSEILERQIRKNRTRLEKKLRQSAFEPDLENDSLYEVDEEGEFRIVKNKKFAIKPMSSEEAILQMNLLNHLFYIYRDDKTEDICIVYKRKSGDYGLIGIEE